MMKRFAVVVAAMLAVFALAACSGSSQGSSASSSGSGSSSSSSSSSVETAGGEDVVTISLDYNAGTGHEWTCSADPEGIVSEVGHDTEDKAADKNITGGPLQERFTFRAMKQGEVVLTFKLARSWETGDPAETQVYAFTVSNDLKMTLNPYKSDFMNEPEWGSNS